MANTEIINTTTIIIIIVSFDVTGFREIKKSLDLLKFFGTKIYGKDIAV